MCVLCAWEMKNRESVRELGVMLGCGPAEWLKALAGGNDLAAKGNSPGDFRQAK